MTSSEYEELISQLADRMTNDTQLISSGKPKWGRSNLWEGVSGYEHQIDVSLENDNIHLLLFKRRCLNAT